MNTLAELIVALRAGRTTLPKLLAMLDERGPTPPANYLSELAGINRLGDSGALDLATVVAITERLREVQLGDADATQPTQRNLRSITPVDDATIVKPAAPRPLSVAEPMPGTAPATAPPFLAPASSPADDVTRIAVLAALPASPSVAAPPPSQPAPSPVDSDATVIRTLTIVPPGAPASPPAVPPLAAAAGAEITVVQPVSHPASSLPFAASPAVPDTIATQSGTRTGTVSGTASGTSSSWQRISEAEGGEFVTVGSLLKGRFHLEKEIGRGGMGVVYMARDERKVEARDRDPYVAVKVLNDEFRRHPDSLIALQRESRRSQQLAHDNIVRVFDFDKDGTIVYMTMEYIDGSDLKSLIRDKAYNGLPLKDARPLIEGMCRGLTRAHAEGVVHSDFKPGNVMVTKAGVPKVFDFGIARAGKMGDAVGETTVFDAGSLGALTPAYASLEMIQGKEPENADDIYALGCVAFELLTGKHPFDKVSAEIAHKEGRKPPPVPGLTKRQYRALCAAVAFTRNQRMKNAMDLVEGLRELSFAEQAMPYLKVGAPAVLVFGGGIWGLLSWRENQRLDQLFARFEVTSPSVYATEDEAAAALDSIDEDTRIRLVQVKNDLIARFFADRIDRYWNPAQDRLDYPSAQRIFALRDRLKLYSPTLDIKRADVERTRNDLLNTLESTLTAQIDAGQIFESDADNAIKTLSRIKAIDPNSGLLKNARLELKYDAAIGASLDKGKVDLAKERLEVASRWFADSSRIKARASQIRDLGASLVAEQEKVQELARVRQSRERAISVLTELVDRPVNMADWRSKLADAYRRADEAVADDKALGSALEIQAARLRSVLAAQIKDTADLAAAIDLAGFGLDLFPGDPALAKARQGLLDRQNKLTQEAQTQAQRIVQSKARIVSLLAKPLGTAVWLQDLRSALNEASGTVGASSPEFENLRIQVGAGVQKLARERVAAGALDDAERLAKAGQQINAADAGYAAILRDIDRARGDVKSKVAAAEAQKLAAARKALSDLLAMPQLTIDWQRSVAAATDALKADSAPETRALVDSLGDKLATEVAKVTSPQWIPQARLALDFGLKAQPKSAKLLEQRARIDQLQRDNQAKVDQESADAEVKARIESVKIAAAANDVQKARESLARIKALQPDNPFVKIDGQKLLVDAYLRLAAEAFQRKDWQIAVDVVVQGVKSLGDRPEFKGPRARYELVAAMMKRGDQPLSQAAYEALKRQLAETTKLDPVMLSKVEAELAAAGVLKEKTFAAKIEKIKPGGGVVVTPPPGFAPPQEASPAPVPVPTPAPTPSAGVPLEHEMRTSAENKSASGLAATVPKVADSEGTSMATGPDPCNKPTLIGTGKACFDELVGTRRGPRLTIVPGVGGASAYGLTRSEVSIANFNDFCSATGSCTPKPITDEDFANAPITGISVSQANAYAAWLTKVSGGYTYRLPTDAEWLHAAKGGGGFKRADNSNCVPPGGQPGGGSPVSAKGKEANPWGLIHMSGNVWEWVTTDGRLMARGAGFNEYWSDCTIDAKRDDDGQPKKDAGFRVLRELK